MRRFFAAYVVGLLLVPALLLLPGRWHAAEGGDDSTAEPITHYEADFDVRNDGSMAVTERITVDFRSSESHGIFRYFDRHDPNAPLLRRTPQDLGVTVDGVAATEAEVRRTTEHRGRFVVYRVGSADRTLSPGEHTYVLRYTIQDVLLPAGSRSRFYWNLVPGGWDNTIDDIRLRVHLPSGIGPVRCRVGWGEGYPCDRVAPGPDGDSFTVTQDSIWFRTPITVRTNVDVRRPPLAQDLRPWSLAAERTWGPSLVGAGLALLLAFGIAAGGAVLVWRRCETRPAFPLVSGPPEHIGPAQAAYLLRRRFTDEMFTASLLQAAVAGMIMLGRGRKGTWRSRPGSGDWTVDDDVTRRLAGSFADRDVSFDRSGGSRVNDARHDLARATERWALDERLLTDRPSPSWLRWAQAVAASAGLVLAVVLASYGPAVWALPFAAASVLAATALLLEDASSSYGALVAWVVGVVAGAVFVWGVLAGHGEAAFVAGVLGTIVALCVLPLIGPEPARGGLYRQATPEGRDLWSRVGGFRRMLATDSAEARHEFAARKELYVLWLPYAVAFGCADAWARKFPDVSGLVPPSPDAGSGDGSGADRAAASERTGPGLVGLAGSLHDFAGSADTAIRESIGAYASASRAAARRHGGSSSGSSGGSSSSSSGGSSAGGGFSGGGGGGGGGGGTW